MERVTEQIYAADTCNKQRYESGPSHCCHLAAIHLPPHPSYPSIHPSIRLSIYPSFHPPTLPSNHPSVCPICLFIYPITHCPSIHPSSIYPSIRPFIHPPTQPSSHLINKCD